MPAVAGLTPEQLAAFERDGKRSLPVENPKRATARPPHADDADADDAAAAPPKQKKTGFLAIPGFASDDEVRSLRERARELIQSADLTTAAASIFSTVRQQKKVHGGYGGSGGAADDDNDGNGHAENADADSPASSDAHFLDSAGAVSCFLEEKAVDPATGAVTAPRESAVNKIGHALHDRDAAFRAFSRSAKVSGVLRSLGYARPLPVQSMYIVKGPRIGGEVSPHRDDTFLATEPRASVVGLWVALEAADRSNGCLFAVPGSHRDGGGEPDRRFVLRAAGGEAGAGAGGAGGKEQQQEAGGPGGAAANKKKALAFTAPQPSYDLSRAVPIECPAGTLVLLHGHVLHFSGENTSAASRHSYASHYVEGGKGLRWAGDNWLQRADGFEPLYCDEGQPWQQQQQRREGRERISEFCGFG